MFRKLKQRIKNKIRNVIGYNELISMKELVTTSFEKGESKNVIRHNELFNMIKELITTSAENEEGRNIKKYNELIDIIKKLVIAPLEIITGGGGG